MEKTPQNLRTMEALTAVVRTLRGPDGCPWDKEQTHRSLTRFLLEESGEFIETIDKSDDKAMCEELGDVLFQVILHAQIAEERKAFSLADVIETLNEKMIRRHPHVFGDVKATTSDEVIKNWNQIKAQEKTKSDLDRVFDFPKAVSPLLASQKIGERSGRVRFDWPNVKDVFAKVSEEFAELESALDSGTLDEQGHEIGDMLFTLVQLARHLKLDADGLLRETNLRFERRLRCMFELIAGSSKELADLSTDDIETLWQTAKRRVDSHK